MSETRTVRTTLISTDFTDAMRLAVKAVDSSPVGPGTIVAPQGFALTGIAVDLLTEKDGTVHWVVNRLTRHARGRLCAGFAATYTFTKAA
jgi:hypothetical protein